MGLQAYRQAAQRAENPRETEYRLLGQVTRALIEAAREGTELSARMDALHWNRSVWSALESDCLGPDNRLPVQLRAGIVSLSRWVGRQTSAAVRDAAEIDALVDVNRMMMQGLAAQPQAA